MSLSGEKARPAHCPSEVVQRSSNIPMSYGPKGAVGLFPNRDRSIIKRKSMDGPAAASGTEWQTAALNARPCARQETQANRPYSGKAWSLSPGLHHLRREAR